MSFLNEKATFEKHGTKFQENLVQLILDDRAFCDQVSEVSDTSFLELKYLRVFVDKILDYCKKYGTHPSRDTITTLSSSTMKSSSLKVTSSAASIICLR